MTAKKPATVKRYKRIGSDMKKVDAYVLGPKDYEEIPELTREDFARGVWHIGGKPTPRGRPKADVTKDSISVRLDRDVIAHFRGTGRGWQTRMNAALRKAAKLPSVKRQKKA